MPKRMNNPARPHDQIKFRDYECDDRTIEDMARFVQAIWRDPMGARFFFVATKSMSGKWKEHPVQASALEVELEDFLAAHSRWDNDLYFCPNAFSEPRRKKEFALRTVWGWCDMDESDPKTYRPQPSILWSTSPGRTQALWLWSEAHRPERAEDISRSLAKRHDGDDGWSIT